MRHKLFWAAFSVLFIQQFVALVRYQGWGVVGGDAEVYWLAGKGMIEHQYIPEEGTRQREIYDRFPPGLQQSTAFLYGEVWRRVFGLFVWIPRAVFKVLVATACFVAYLILIWRVVDEIPYGWAVALLVTRYAEGFVVAGNLGTPMALALTTPVGMAMAGALKLHLALVATLGAGLWCFNQRGDSWDEFRLADLRVADPVASQTRKAHFLRYCRYLAWAARLELPGNQKSHHVRTQ